MGFTGFTLVMPFLPLYIKQLGVEDVGEIALWSGLSLGVTPAVTAVLSPFWGRVADRFGRKLMVQRSLFSFVVVMAAMAYVTHPWHFFALRALQGLFAGYGGLTMAMAAESAPRERLARALGLVQTAQRVGPAVGPVIGGAVAALVGLRETFFVTSGFYLVALALVTVLYRDPVHSPGEHALDPAAGLPEWHTLLRAPGFAMMMAAIGVLTFVDRTFGPILPLWIEQHGVAVDRVAVTSGVLFSAAAFGAAVGNHICERAVERYEAATVIAVAGVAGVTALLGFVLVREPWTLALVLCAFGVATGLATTAAYTRGGCDVPAAAHGMGYGLLNAAALTGLAVGPVVAGLLAKASLLWVFGIDMALLALLPLVLGLRPQSARRAPVTAQERLGG